MRTTIDKAGRLVVPKRLREELGLSAGTTLAIDAADGALVLRPVGPRTSVEHVNGRPVLRTDEAVEPLTVEAVRELVERGRR